jgi:AcrR family transcriptional regulator
MAAANPRPRQTGMTSEKLRETPGAKAAKPAPRRQKTAKYDRKLVEILRTAAAVFAEVGFDPASIRMVADRADVSVAGLYYYVHSKEELLYLIQYHVFDGLVRRFDSDSEQMLAEGGDAARPEARLYRFIHNHLDHFLADMDSLTVCTRELARAAQRRLSPAGRNPATKVLLAGLRDLSGAVRRSRRRRGGSAHSHPGHVRRHQLDLHLVRPRE